MPAYVIAETDVTDPERYEQYKAASSTAITAGGGRFLIRGSELAVLKGDWQPTRLVVLEFEDLAARSAGMSQRSTRRQESSVRARRTCVWSPCRASTRFTGPTAVAPQHRSRFLGVRGLTHPRAQRAPVLAGPLLFCRCFVRGEKTAGRRPPVTKALRAAQTHDRQREHCSARDTSDIFTIFEGQTQRYRVSAAAVRPKVA